MALALIIFGAAFAVVGIRGTQAQLGSLLASDFTGSGSFVNWIIAIFAVGAIGYYTPLRGASRLFLLLILLVFVLSNRGLFARLQSASSAPSEGSAGPATSQVTAVLPGASNTSNSQSGTASGLPGAGGIAANAESLLLQNLPALPVLGF